MNNKKLYDLFLCLITLLAITFCNIGNAYAKNILKAIIIKNNKRIEKETILSYLDLSKGDPIDKEILNQSLKKLYDSGLFSDLDISLNKDKLTITVTENSIINIISFKGNNQIDKETLEKEISLKPRNVFTKNKLLNDLTRLQTIYKRNGRFNVTIKPEIVELKQNRIDLNFNISEGKKNKIKKINIIGNKKISNAAIKEVMNSKENNFLRILSSNTSFDPERFEYDKELIRRFYLSHGFLDYKLKYSTSEITYDKKYFILTLFIEEGKRYILNKVDIESNLKKVNTKNLRKIIDINIGKIINVTRINENIDILVNKMSELGYAFVDVKANYNKHKKKGLIDIRYQINEGSKVYIDRINITGNTRTLDKVIRREITFSEGDAFNTSKIKNSTKNIKNTGFFKKVTIEKKPNRNSSNGLSLNVGVEEQSTGKMHLGFGFSSNDGILGEVGISEDNFLGKGQKLKLNYTRTKDNSEKIFGFTEPYFLGKDLSLGFNIFSIKNFSSSEYSYDSDIKGLSLNSGYPISKNLNHLVSLNYKSTKIKDIQKNASIYIKSQEGEYDSVSINHTLSYDRLDSKYDPSDGYFAKLFQNFNFLGSDSKYIKTQLDLYSYFPFTKEGVIIRNIFKGGYILPLQGDDVRFHNRFYLGGNSFRGFEKLGLGPRDLKTDDALGGNFFYKTETEIVLPINFLKELNIKGSFFIDTGTIYDIPEDNKFVVNDFSVRASAGFSVSWPSPIGPITMYWAWAFLKKDYDKTEVMNFNFGTRF